MSLPLGHQAQELRPPMISPARAGSSSSSSLRVACSAPALSGPAWDLPLSLVPRPTPPAELDADTRFG